MTSAVDASSLEQARQECHDFLSRELVRLSREMVRPRILSVNNGLFPEAKTALSSMTGRGTFCAMDQDPEVCALVERWHTGSSMRAVCGSIFDIAGESFDVIYSRTLLSSTPLHELRRTLLGLIWRLAPEGRLLLTGFTAAEDHSQVWSQQKLGELAAAFPNEALSGHVITLSRSGLAVFLEVQA